MAFQDFNKAVHPVFFWALDGQGWQWGSRGLETQPSSALLVWRSILGFAISRQEHFIKDLPQHANIIHLLQNAGRQQKQSWSSWSLLWLPCCLLQSFRCWCCGCNCCSVDMYLFCRCCADSDDCCCCSCCGCCSYFDCGYCCWLFLLCCGFVLFVVCDGLWLPVFVLSVSGALLINCLLFAFLSFTICSRSCFVHVFADSILAYGLCGLLCNSSLQTVGSAAGKSRESAFLLCSSIRDIRLLRENIAASLALRFVFCSSEVTSRIHPKVDFNKADVKC